MFGTRGLRSGDSREGREGRPATYPASLANMELSLRGRGVESACHRGVATRCLSSWVPRDSTVITAFASAFQARSFRGGGPHHSGLVSHCGSELPLPQLHASSAHSPLHRDPCTAAVPGALSPSPCTWMERRKAWPSVRRKQVHHGRRGTWETVTEGRESVWQAQAATLLMDAPIHACILHSFIHAFIHSSMHPFMHSTRPSCVSVPGCYRETKPAGSAHTDHRPGGGDAGPPGGCRSRAEGLLTLTSDVRRDSWKVRHL